MKQDYYKYYVIFICFLVGIIVLLICLKSNGIGSLADWFGAIGTMLAAVISLGIALYTNKRDNERIKNDKKIRSIENDNSIIINITKNVNKILYEDELSKIMKDEMWKFYGKLYLLNFEDENINSGSENTENLFTEKDIEEIKNSLDYLTNYYDKNLSDIQSLEVYVNIIKDNQLRDSLNKLIFLNKSIPDFTEFKFASINFYLENKNYNNLSYKEYKKTLKDIRDKFNEIFEYNIKIKKEIERVRQNYVGI